MTSPVRDKRTRKSAADRMSEMLDIVDTRLSADRSATVSMKDIGDAVGASRALVYAYFPDQFRLLDAVLDRHIAQLRDAGIEEAASHGSLIERVTACAEVYLHHVIRNGAALEIVLREPATARQLNGNATAFRGTLYRRLANVARFELRMGAEEALALIQLLVVIPDESARLIASGSLTLDEALELNSRLIESSIEALRPQPQKDGQRTLT